jgi:hypothetical protein
LSGTKQQQNLSLCPKLLDHYKNHYDDGEEQHVSTRSPIDSLLDKPWPGAGLVMPPKSYTLPDIIIRATSSTDFHIYAGAQPNRALIHC